MKRVAIKLLFAFFIALFLSVAYLFLPQKVFSLDNQLRDFLFLWRGELPKEQSQRVVIVDIDERSIQKIGQWPWSRNVISQLLQSITLYNPGIIGLDIVFAEPDRTSPHLLQKQFPSLNVELPNYDAQLAQVFLTTPVVGGYLFFFDKRSQQEPPILPAVFIAPQNNAILKPQSLTANIPILQNALYSSGFFNNIPDDNGMIRYISLIMEYDGVLYSSLVLEMIRIYSGANRVEFIPITLDSGMLQFGEYQVPVDSSGRLFINFRGSARHFEYISAIDILEENVTLSQLQNKFVLVGTSALGLYDLRSMTFDSNIPGVEVHANAIDNILSGDFLHRTQNSVVDDLMTLWLVMFITVFLFHFSPSWATLFLFATISIALSTIFYTLLFTYSLVLNLLFPLVSFVFGMFVSIGVDYFISHKQKEQTRQILGKKVSIGVMDYLIKHQSEKLVLPREVEVTIFFSDIQGFTTISEKIGSPNQLIALLNAYMTPMVENIVSHYGTIDKFIGDAIMAYWNAPVEVANHADHAVQSAIEQLQRLKEVNQHQIAPKYHLSVGIGIGIHTGIVTAGDMGSEGRSDYTIIGDNVNFASRLEGLTRHYDANILISKATYEKLKKEYKIRPIDIVEVKGKSEAIEIFEVMDAKESYHQEEIDRFSKTLKLFREGKVIEAKVQFQSLQKEFPSKLYTHYIERCEEFILHPSIEFTPIRKMYSK